MRHILQIAAKKEILMTELTNATAVAAGEPLTPAKQAADFFSDLPRLIGDEIAFARDEVLDQAQTETHLFNEFVSKMAQAHSVNDIKTMYEVCSQHQIDFVSRHMQRVFEHAKRSINVASTLFEARLQS
jgi:hypothetical protein